MPRKSSTPALDAPTLAALHVVELAEGKFHYKTADAALDVLLQQVKAGEVITLPKERFVSVATDAAIRKLEIPSELRGKKFLVKDKFADRNSIGVGLSARRFELEELTSP